MLIISKDNPKIKALKKSLTKRFKIEDLYKIFYKGKNHLKWEERDNYPILKYIY